MATVRLIHWNEHEGLERQRQLEALGYNVRFDGGDGTMVMRSMKAAALPDAVLIDLTRLPSHGREAGRVLRVSKATRHVPLVFVDGEPAKVAHTRALLPDATYTSWGRIKAALRTAIARPVPAPVVPTDTMSGKPAVAKLGINPGFKVCLLGSPPGFASTLTPLPVKVMFTARPDASCHIFLCFLRSARELHAHALALRGVIDRQPLWLIWPKKASGVTTDLDGNLVRAVGLAAGWVDYKICSIDETWSALAFKRRK